MKAQHHLKFGIGFAALMAVGALQGSYIDQIQSDELFYRWLLNGSTQFDLEGTLRFDDSTDLPDSMDNALFTEALEAGEAFLPDFPADEEEDYDANGKVEAKLIRGVRQGEDQWIWRLSRDSSTADVRARFLKYARSGNIRSLGEQMDMGEILNSQVPGVGTGTFLLGFRTLAANFTWLQVDKHWHAGQMHRMLPLMKTCVTLDPHFVDAFLLGAWHLAYNIPARLPDTPEPLKKWNEKHKRRLGYKEEWYYFGVDFLRDGILKNPRDYRLYFDLGYSIYENKLNDHPNAVRYLDEARRHKHDRWVRRMLYLAMMRNGQHEDAIEGWHQYLELFPDNLAGPRFIQVNQAYLHEIRWKEAKECARAAERAAETERTQAQTARDSGDSASAAEYEARARQADANAEEMRNTARVEKFSAKSIWEEMYKFNEDELADARLNLIEAQDLADEGRVYEALPRLEIARWEAAEFFDEISDLMIELKERIGEPLTQSELTYVLRTKEAKEAIRLETEAGRFTAHEEFKVPRRIPCEYIQVD